MDNTKLTYASLDDWLAANPLYQWRVTSVQTLPDPIDSQTVKPAVPMQDVADAVGSTRMAVSFWEQGKFMPKFEYIRLLAKLIQYESADKLYDDWLAWKEAQPVTDGQPVAA